MWDAPSAALSWILAAASIIFAMVAGHACHSSATAAAFFLALATCMAIQLLGFLATCISYSSWVVMSVSMERRGPSQQEPRMRRGLPALKSPNSKAGLDAWSLFVIALLVAPILAPAVTFHRPSQILRFKGALQQPVGISIASAVDKNRNGAPKSTVGGYEAVQLSLQVEVPGAGQNMKMSNTASVAIDTATNRVYVPSRVAAACMHPVVTARNITAAVGTYSCNIMVSGKQDECGEASDGSGKGLVCVTINNASQPGRPAGDQHMRAQHPDLRADCAVTYSLARLDVTWRGDNKDFTAARGWARNCRITDFKLRESIPMARADWAKIPNYEDLLGNSTLQLLTLPLINAYVHTMGHDKVVYSFNDEARIDFYGSIFAAATTTRALGLRFDPTRSNDTVQVHYADKVCQQYGWSGMVGFLLVANILLAACCSAACSGRTLYNLGDDIVALLGSIFCARCCLAAADSKQGNSAPPPTPTTVLSGFTSNHEQPHAMQQQQSRDGSPAVSTVAVITQ